MDVLLIVLILFMLHLLFCIMTFILIKTGWMKVSMQLFPLVFFLPVWGVWMVFNARRLVKHNLAGSKEIEIDRLALLDSDYRTIHLVDDESENKVVPLEEAIFLNDAGIRRKMMMDILEQDPKQYIALLQRARLDDDIEVTHYASTAIMEVQREYEMDIRLYEKEMSDMPDNPAAIERCIQAYKMYIDSGLMTSTILSIQRTRYRDILQARLALPAPDRQVYFDAVDNLLDLELLPQAKNVLDQALAKWPRDERGWILQIKYYNKTENKGMVRHTIFQMQNLYLSPQGRECVAFWNR